MIQWSKFTKLTQISIFLPTYSAADIPFYHMPSDFTWEGDFDGTDDCCELPGNLQDSMTQLEERMGSPVQLYGR